MGSRAQILIEDEGVYLYTHWGADNLKEDLKAILDTSKARNRWNDPEYLARIIFSEMIKNDINGETGFGIGSSEHGDIQLLIILNVKDNTIIIKNIFSNRNKKYSSFQNFIDN